MLSDIAHQYGASKIIQWWRQVNWVNGHQNPALWQIKDFIMTVLLLRQKCWWLAAYTIIPRPMPPKRFCFKNSCRQCCVFFYYDHRDLTKMLPRCSYNSYFPSTLFIRLWPAYCWLRPGYACFEHVQNKRGERMQLPDLGDPTPTKPRHWSSSHVWPTFGLRLATLAASFPL